MTVFEHAAVACAIASVTWLISGQWLACLPDRWQR